MKFCGSLLLLVLLACAPFSSTGGVAPWIFAVDWHPGGLLYVAYTNGKIAAYDPTSGREVARFAAPSSFRPSEIVSARIERREVLFVSGFIGREGTVVEWDDTGRVVKEFRTPELATGFGLDPGTTAGGPILYVASGVDNVVLSMNLREVEGQQLRQDAIEVSFKTIANIDGTGSLGSVVFDPVYNRLFIGDSRNGELYLVDCKTREHTTAARGLGEAISLALDSDSRALYVGDFHGRVSALTINQRGELLRMREITTVPGGITAISLGPDNSLYVASGSRLSRISVKTGREIPTGTR